MGSIGVAQWSDKCFFVKCNSTVQENLLSIDYSKKLNDTVQREVNKVSIKIEDQ